MIAEPFLLLTATFNPSTWAGCQPYVKKALEQAGANNAVSITTGIYVFRTDHAYWIAHELARMLMHSDVPFALTPLAKPLLCWTEEANLAALKKLGVPYVAPKEI